MGHRWTCGKGDSLQEQMNELKRRSMSLHARQIPLANPTNHKLPFFVKTIFMRRDVLHKVQEPPELWSERGSMQKDDLRSLTIVLGEVLSRLAHDKQDLLISQCPGTYSAKLTRSVDSAWD
jgi:hypothetical protein